LRILVVEDDPMNVELFEAALETDHELVVERDGPAGEARALAERFDLILLDIQLPKRSGIDVCRNLRARGLKIPIVAVSASVLPEEVARTKEAGFVSFWSKPIAPADLRAAVKSLAHPSTPRSAPRHRQDPAGGAVTR
jgi:CheY-like chemotaxis protein